MADELSIMIPNNQTPKKSISDIYKERNETLLNLGSNAERNFIYRRVGDGMLILPVVPLLGFVLAVIMIFPMSRTRLLRTDPVSRVNCWDIVGQFFNKTYEDNDDHPSCELYYSGFVGGFALMGLGILALVLVWIFSKRIDHSTFLALKEFESSAKKEDEKLKPSNRVQISIAHHYVDRAVSSTRKLQRAYDNVLARTHPKDLNPHVFFQSYPPKIDNPQAEQPEMELIDIPAEDVPLLNLN
jgi:hypothetical protein